MLLNKKQYFEISIVFVYIERKRYNKAKILNRKW